MPIHRIVRFSLCALLAMLGVSVIHPVPVTAFVGFRPPLPDELKMTSEPLAPGGPAIILYRQVDRDDNALTGHEDNYFRVKILTEEGRKQADVEIPYYKDSGDVTGIHARTIRPDGSVVDFDGKVFTKSLVKRRGVNYMAKTFTLPEVQVGSIIEYYYVAYLKEHWVFDSHWILSSELFTKSARFSLKPFEDNYNSLHLRWTYQGLPPGTLPPKQGPDRFIRLEASNIPAFQTEDYMPPENELKSRVDFSYSRDLPESDADKFWAKTGKRLNGQLESFVDRRKAMEQAVAEIVAPDDPPETKLQKIYARVQEMRNTSYEVQKTEQEEARAKEKQGASVEDVWKSGHGSGVQLTWLFLALARAAGLEAYGLWVPNRANYFFNPSLMQSDRLDANVVLVKLPSKDIFCDPGAAFTPFGLLPWMETGVRGLRLDKKGVAWVQTPIPDSTVSRIERKANLKLSEKGDLEGKLAITFTGLEALRLRVDERNADEVERKKVLEDMVKAYIPAACELELTNKPDWNSSAPSMVAEFDLKIPGWASAAGHRALVSVGLFSAQEKHTFDHAERVHPIYVDYPFRELDDVSVEIPPSWRVASLPPGRSDLGRIVECTFAVEKDHSKLHWTRMLNLNFVILETKYYGPLRSFFQSVRGTDEEQIVLEAGASAPSQ
jgi:transglutaminase-like putative cysteine protease